MLSAGILAGVDSRRMGENKAFLRAGEHLFIERLVEQLSTCTYEVIISAAQPGIYEDLGLSVVYDEVPDFGPPEGIRQILKKASEEFVFICACDMPYIRSEFVEFLASYICSDYDCYIVVDGEHLHPLCGIYRRTVIPNIEQLIAEGEHKIRKLYQIRPTKFISLEHTKFTSDILQSIDTPEEYRDCKKDI
jgi:molybdopterin-guanine dinucleotide biosynthesis protein